MRTEAPLLREAQMHAHARYTCTLPVSGHRTDSQCSLISIPQSTQMRTMSSSLGWGDTVMSRTLETERLRRPSGTLVFSTMSPLFELSIRKLPDRSTHKDPLRSSLVEPEWLRSVFVAGGFWFVSTAQVTGTNAIKESDVHGTSILSGSLFSKFSMSLAGGTFSVISLDEAF
ncbi:unspecified product [Leishmania tarentolae]|uniref:Unspecified product n=1 Tax=Leishmania tarentolae TaxID=5689 RepID=A0A640KPI0_LEITA|nr:unspecified product [Leishmania tarentolae]